MRGVPPRRLNIVLPLSASITNAPEWEPAPDIARVSARFSDEAGDAAAVPPNGDTSAAKTASSSRRRAIKGFQQGRRARVSLPRSWPDGSTAAILGGSDGYGRQAREARSAEAQRWEGPQAPVEALPHGARAGRRRRDRRRLRDRRPPGARPAGHQPHGQRVRRVRGHERGLVRGRPRRKWRDARGDD